MKLTQQHGLDLRQNYTLVAPRLVLQADCYAHARQHKRMHATIHLLRTRVARVHREIGGQRDRIPVAPRAHVDDLMGRTALVLCQKNKTKNKPYVLHAPEVEYIARSKVRTPYESGVTVSIVTTSVINRCSAIEPTVGHMKVAGKLDRKWLKGGLGDAVHAVLCGAGHNLPRSSIE